jgi:hypothetical protein
LPEDVARSDWTLVSYIGFAITFVPRGGPMRSLRTVSVAIALSATACAFPFSTSSSDSNALDGEIGADHEDGEERGWQVGDDDDSDGDDGCTLTQGYWKNHSDRESGHRNIAWPIDEDTDLCGTTWLDNLGIAPQGNAFYILSHQYIAASLNVAAGAVAPPDVSAALDEAESLMADCQITDAERARAVELAGVLDDFNNGRTGPGHCGDGPQGGEGEGDCDGEVCSGGEGEGEGDTGCDGEACSGEGEGEGEGEDCTPIVTEVGTIYPCNG